MDNIKDIESELLLNLQILLVNSITERMRYIFVELVSEKEFNILVYYFKEPLAIDTELINDVCDNVLANTSTLLRYFYEYVVNDNAAYESIRKLRLPIFGRYENSSAIADEIIAPPAPGRV